jgi:L-amino acid N-acyltransferase YncA
MRTRLARTGDAEAIRQIYNAAVETIFTFDLRPRELADQEAWLRDRAGAYAAVVAVDAGDQIVGFAALSPYKNRPAYSTTVEDSIYVRADQRGRGVGRLLLDELLAVATGHGFHSVIARMVANNNASIGLHTAAGFVLVGTEREVGRKFRQWLDIVEMQKLLNAAPTPADPSDGLDAEADLGTFPVPE